MPFSKTVRETALVKSGRYCCICYQFSGRDVNVHHIIQEADGGVNTLDNAIVLCSRCHGEVGHYNPRHPLGTKYSPNELRRHRDKWWAYCENHDEALCPKGSEMPFDSIPDAKGLAVVEKEIGVLWSH